MTLPPDQNPRDIGPYRFPSREPLPAREPRPEPLPEHFEPELIRLDDRLREIGARVEVPEGMTDRIMAASSAFLPAAAGPAVTRAPGFASRKLGARLALAAGLALAFVLAGRFMQHDTNLDTPSATLASKLALLEEPDADFEAHAPVAHLVKLEQVNRIDLDSEFDAMLGSSTGSGS